MDRPWGISGCLPVSATTLPENLLNDLWKFDGTNWIWMGGSQIGNRVGTYGAPGTASTSNLASSRSGAVSWTDASGNLWFFGGLGEDPTDPNKSGNLNDLWRYTP